MLQTYSSQQPTTFEDRGQVLGLPHYLGILKRRLFHFLIPFGLVAILGFLVVAIQRPVYQAEGKILVESQEIPADLVRPTVTTAANERIQVIEQRIMTRDNLLAIISKFGLFVAEQKWLSASQLLDLMRERAHIKLVDVQGPTPARQNVSTIAFTLSFEDESPARATAVTNEFLTLILNEDARSRTNRATETTKFLEKEVRRLEGELDAAALQISEIKQRPHEVAPDTPEREKAQLTALANLKTELIQKSAVYSDAHPAVTALKKRIAAMEKTVTPPSQAAAAVKSADDGLETLERQRQAAEKRLEESRGKLAAAHLGETLERDQQSERLQVIEQPTQPQKPLRPNRPKLLGFAFAFAAMVGAGAIFAAEALDRSIRGSHELLGVVDSHLIVTIPYISTRAEAVRKKRKVILGVLALVMILSGGLAGAVYLGLEIDLSSIDWSWLYLMTRLSK